MHGNNGLIGIKGQYSGHPVHSCHTLNGIVYVMYATRALTDLAFFLFNGHMLGNTSYRSSRRLQLQVEWCRG